MGFGIGISDIRVSWGEHHEDCLQKIHEVGPFIAAAFAGYVRFGFWAIADLRDRLKPVDREGAWMPQRAALKWHRRARRAFANCQDEERDLTAAVMLIGVSPDKDMGISGWARPSVAIMRSPDFSPRFLNMNAVEAIGSGTTVDEFNDLLRSLQENAFHRAELEAAMPGASAEAFRDAIFRVLQDHPQLSVSSHVHLCVVRRGSVEIAPSNFTVVSEVSGEWWISDPEVAKLIQSDSRRIDMPPVASTWEEYEALCAKKGLSAAAGSC